MDDEQDTGPEHSNGGTITSVEQDIRKRGLYHIYLDHKEEAALTLHEDVVVRYRLSKGAVLSAAAIDDIREAGDRHQAYRLAVAYLGVKARTAKEIERYLLRKEVQAEYIGVVIERLAEEQFIDDADYAERFARQRLRLQQKGSRRIQQELLQRGVSKAVAVKAVNGLDREDELQAAIRTAAKKWRSLKGEERDRRRKLAMFLLRRGYPHDVARKAVSVIGSEDILEEEGQMLDN
ncbi:RecX family transcriptional regulator [Paenibacillus sp. 1P07SE]|uniref:RecX family transcriptional regulator n=1 Tax=Paenibacillus sp. 1P07SE TaxID=3132209 RepID=UPI0039A45779